MEPSLVLGDPPPLACLLASFGTSVPSGLGAAPALVDGRAQRGIFVPEDTAVPSFRAGDGLHLMSVSVAQ